MDEQELVGLVYRADWTRLSLTGTVRGCGQFPETSWDEAWWPSGSFGDGRPPEPPEWLMATAERPDDECALSVAPGRRYRLERTDGSRVLGCDGERVWQWLADVPPGAAVKFERRPQPPVPTLLAPAWLLTSGRLTIEGETEVAGRPGIVVAAVAAAGPARGPGTAAMLAWGLLPRAQRVAAVIDAELGIVLRRESHYQEGRGTVTEFARLEVGGKVDPAAFDPAAGSFFGDGKAAAGGSPRPAAEHIGLEALKMVGGLAAGGLGAAIRYSPKRQPDPFATATGEGPDDVMPDDEPLPGSALGSASEGGQAGDRTPAGDEVLRLLHRSGLEPTPFSGRLLEWTDGEVLGRGMLGAVPESARRAGFGGVGYLIDAMLDAAEGAGLIQHAVYSVRVGTWDRYRVDRVFRAPSARRRPRVRRRVRGDAVTVACDGERMFRVFENEVRAGPAAALDDDVPGDLRHLVDGSWLLQYRLSGGDLVEVDGRPGYRVIATAGEGPLLSPPMSWIPGLWLPAVAVVDASSGRLLRLTRYRDGQIATRVELRSVSDGGSDDFAFTPPDGLPVNDEPAWSYTVDADADGGPKIFGPDGEEFDPNEPHGIPFPMHDVVDAVKEQLDEKVAAVRGFLGSFLGGPRLAGLAGPLQAARNSERAAAVSRGTSSARKWPHGSERAVTFVAYSPQILATSP